MCSTGRDIILPWSHPLSVCFKWNSLQSQFIMHRRRMLRALPVFILMFFIVLIVDFQLRTRNLHKLNSIHNPSGGDLLRSIQEAPLSPAKEPPKPAKFPRQPAAVSTMNQTVGGLQAEIQRRRDKLRALEQRRVVVTPSLLRLTDIFLAVKSTGRFHGTRLSLLLETWISKTKEHVSVIDWSSTYSSTLFKCYLIFKGTLRGDLSIIK